MHAIGAVPEGFKYSAEGWDETKEWGPAASFHLLDFCMPVLEILAKSSMLYHDLGIGTGVG